MATRIEVRNHYFLNRRSIISFARGLRPKDFEPDVSTKRKKCPFCPGNEEGELEIGRYEKNGKWEIRWIDNKYPALSQSSSGRKSVGFLKQQVGKGYHEVIIETPVHGKAIFELSDDDILKLFEIFQDRIKELYKKPGIKYVVLFKNFGPSSGATIAHEHSQIVAQPFVPTQVSEKIKALKKYKKCLYCETLAKELKSSRRISHNKHFVAFCPYAPRFNNEVWVVPKRHIKRYSDFKKEELSSLTRILKEILPKVMKITNSYNLLFFDAPKGKDMHFHLEICPRTSVWAGYEFLSSDYIISISPEVSASFYRS